LEFQLKISLILSKHYFESELETIGILI